MRCCLRKLQQRRCVRKPLHESLRVEGRDRDVMLQVRCDQYSHSGCPDSESDHRLGTVDSIGDSRRVWLGLATAELLCYDTTGTHCLTDWLFHLDLNSTTGRHRGTVGPRDSLRRAVTRGPPPPSVNMSWVTRKLLPTDSSLRQTVAARHIMMTVTVLVTVLTINTKTQVNMILNLRILIIDHRDCSVHDLSLS
eukprot:g41547.t1